MRKLLFCLLMLTFHNQAFAVDLTMPIECSYGNECFIENYFDHEKDPNKFSDYTCGHLAKNGNTSTDFKLRSYDLMEEKINVLAADTGVVKYVRDGMGDISVSLIGEEAVRGRECGNGIVIEHKRNFQTQYCHLMQDSIIVKPGEKVEKGQAIGKVGLSGLTSFPYLEFTVSQNGVAMDPFTGNDPVTEDPFVPCGTPDIYPLWDRFAEKQLNYVTTNLLTMGFSNRVPHIQGAREGKFNRKKIKTSSKILSFWADIFGVFKGDQVRVTITDPNGEVIKLDEKNFNSNRRQYFIFVGKKLKKGSLWKAGTYSARIQLVRKDITGSDTIFDEVASVEVE